MSVLPGGVRGARLISAPNTRFRMRNVNRDEEIARKFSHARSEAMARLQASMDEHDLVEAEGGESWNSVGRLQGA